MKFRIERPLFWWYFSLALLVVGCFWSAVLHDFVNWDDPTYVLENRSIQKLNVDNLKALFTSFFQGHYHPLALLSLAIDFCLFGIEPKVYLAHNLLLHCISTCLLFLFLVRQFQAKKTAFVAAAFFAVHPLRLESVVWIAERKDVLFLCWFLAAMVLYQLFVLSNKRKWYWLAMVAFIFALLAKSTAVLLPFFLLVLQQKERPFSVKNSWSLLPFVLLSLVFGVVAIKAVSNSVSIAVADQLQSGAFTSILAFGWYFGATLIPLKLAVLYPFILDNQLIGISVLGWTIFVSMLVYGLKKSNFGVLFLLVLAIVSLLPFLPFNGVLLSPFNDRYSYLFALAISLLLAQLAADCQVELKKQFTAIAGFVVLGYSLLSMYQMPNWKNSETLWTNVIHRDSNNYIARLNRAEYYASKGQIETAKADLFVAHQARPQSAVVIENLYTIAVETQQVDEAIEWGSKLFELEQSITLANEIGLLCYNNKRFGESEIFYVKSLKVSPAQPDVEINLALIAFQKGNIIDTEQHLKKALQIQPDFIPALEKLGTFYYQLGNGVAACDLLRKAEKLGSTKAAQMVAQICS